MEVSMSDPVIALCQACGAMATHHPFVKPWSPLVGLVCGRCGHVYDGEIPV